MTGIESAFYPGRLVQDGQAIPVARVRLFIPGIVQSRLAGRLATAQDRTLADWVAKWERAVHLAWMTDGRPTWTGPAALDVTALVTHEFTAPDLRASLQPLCTAVVRLVFVEPPHPAPAVCYDQRVAPHHRGVAVVIRRP